MHELHAQHEAFFLPYGTGEEVCEVVETFGDLDMEYASIRKGCVIFDEPHVGVVRISGDERCDFLNNMLTNKVDDLGDGQSIRAFWLNRKGRIDADLRLAQRLDDMLVALDRSLCAQSVESLSSFVFAEEVEIVNASDEFHRMSIHGPTANRMIALIAPDASDLIESLDEYRHATIEIDGVRTLVEREDLTGEVGLELCVPVEQARSVYEKLLQASADHPELKARPTGWLAINAARIEAGNPMFQIDFGPTNLPVESGIIEQRVNFTKGCYLGQEVVARMHARNACPKKVVALRCDGERVTTEHQEIHQPIGGSQVFEPGKEGETPIGSVTSSTISPMLGAIPICLAMVKNEFATPGTMLKVSAEGALIECVVQESLVFWEKTSAT